MLVKIVWSIVYIASYSFSPNGGTIDGTGSGTALTYYSSKERCEQAASREADERTRDSQWWSTDDDGVSKKLHLLKFQYACVPHREGMVVGLDNVPDGETWQVPEHVPLPEVKPHPSPIFRHLGYKAHEIPGDLQ